MSHNIPVQTFKSETKQMVLSFLEMPKDGAAHSDYFACLSIPTSRTWL